MGKVLITASHFQTLCQEAIQLLESNGHSLILNDHELPYYSFEELAVWAGGNRCSYYRDGSLG